MRCIALCCVVLCCIAMLNIIVLRVAWLSISGVPKVTLLAIAEVKGEGGKTSAIEVEAKGEAEGLVFCI